MDTRHKKRIKLVQDLFSASFDGTTNDRKNEDTLEKIESKRDKIDGLIKQYASRYPLDKISKIDLSILRLAIFELVFDKKNPPKVVIDEAVTLAREFGNEKSYAFINGVLGSIVKNQKNKNEK